MSSTATESLRATEDQPGQRVVQMAAGFMHTAAIYTAAKLGIADLLAAGPRPVSELAGKTASNEDALYRVLRVLETGGVFAQTAPRTFALTPAAEALRSGVPGSMRDLVLWLGNRFHFHVWAELPYSVATGKPAVEQVYHKPCFDALAEMPETNREFNQAMTGYSASVAPAVLQAYDFSGIGTLMDVAGGHGFMLSEILKRHPQMKGILFDLESVVEEARDRLSALLNGRCKTVAGSFFERIPARADACYLQHIIHDWADEPALKILENCRRAIKGAADPRLVIVDSVMPEGPEPHMAKLIDLEMLLMPGGRERTETEWRDLLARAGFEITRIVPTGAPESVIEARPI
jgi:hypothetical protein